MLGSPSDVLKALELIGPICKPIILESPHVLLSLPRNLLDRLQGHSDSGLSLSLQVI